MKSRRSFLKKSVLMAAGIVIGKNTNAFASSAGFPPGIVYTKDNPAPYSGVIRWESTWIEDILPF